MSEVENNLTINQPYNGRLLRVHYTHPIAELEAAAAATKRASRVTG